MKHIRLSTGKELFIGHPGDGFTLATYRPARQNSVDPKVIDPPTFRIYFPGNVFDVSVGKEADEMRDKMLK